MQQYSEKNQELIREARPDATECHTYKQWQARGRQVRKGEKGIRILAPRGAYAEQARPVELVDQGRDPEQEPDISMRFKKISVFDIAQTDPVDFEAEDAA